MKYKQNHPFHSGPRQETSAELDVPYYYVAYYLTVFFFPWESPDRALPYLVQVTTD